MNINTREYWDERFASGDWERKQGRSQTADFAAAQVPYLVAALGHEFSGTLLDFGCGCGDAFPVYRRAFPDSKLIGSDIASTAIDKARASYGDIGTFLVGTEREVPDVDVIVTSNVLEHLTDDRHIVRILRSKCHDLFITVPHREVLAVDGRSEHVNSYTDDSFAELGVNARHVFHCPGWQQVGFELWREVYFKNIVRFVLGRPTRRRKRQVMFHIRGAR